MRYFLKLSYLGTRYHGWQIQPGAVTVQETLEKALTLFLRKKTAVVGAGRTDSGVHASEYFLHFDSEQVIDFDLVYKLNSLLPADIAVQECLPVQPDAHARFSALWRSYTYTLTRKKNPFVTETAYLFQQNLHLENMNQAAAILKDYEDFSSFSKSNTDVKHYLCQVREASWQSREDLLVFHITANRFLRNMVRAIVGTLLNIGLEKQNPKDMHRIILNKKRSDAGFSVPAQGLSLTRITYPENIFLEKTYGE